MIVVIDANIAVALMLNLSYSEQARKAVAEAHSIIAPDLIVHEVTNTLWKIARATARPLSEFQNIVERFPLMFDELVQGRQLASAAFINAITLKHPAYDCFYVALATARNAILMTADGRLVRAIAESGMNIEVRPIQA
ncbi:MAG: type II toxin-antitoxin system VapC family toxin [Hyphomicrobiales bacterium]